MTISPQSGFPGPLGSRYDGAGTSFAIYSAHAETVELCLFGEDNRERRVPLTSRSGPVWHGYLPDVGPGQQYAYRMSGPWRPEQGLRFNPAKLLIDPYARALTGKPALDPALEDRGPEPDPQDSAAVAPKGVVTDDHYDWTGDRPPRTPWEETVIYEAHVRGLSMRHPDVPQSLRGTYAALGHPAIITHLTGLGITALELLPIALHADEPHLQRRGLSNYWGYNTLAPFALEPEYWSGRPGTSPCSEFCDAVKALHAAGIEVILDVVFNHSAEQDHHAGPSLSFRGLDNTRYYWIDEHGASANWSGCGNTLRLDLPVTVQLVMDCLRFWAEGCHVDGFRFDLGTALGRTPAFSPDAPLFAAMLQDPVISRCKLIAEPWDLGSGGYQLGNFPWPFREWNGRYRDDMRDFWLQRSMTLGGFARRLSASDDIFRHSGRPASSGVNFVTAHDGFTLRDLTCFSVKHNQANGEDNRDGTDDNRSNNFGTEGPNAPEGTLAYRDSVRRALLVCLFFSHGTPMLLAGDELGRTQQGNNNAYCQDNELTWVDWAGADKDLYAFTSRLVRLRRSVPALGQKDWWESGARDVQWLNEAAASLRADEWQKTGDALQVVLSGDFLLMVNSSGAPRFMRYPEGAWDLALTTAERHNGGARPRGFDLDAGSAAVFTRRKARDSAAPLPPPERNEALLREQAAGRCSREPSGNPEHGGESSC